MAQLQETFLPAQKKASMTGKKRDTGGPCPPIGRHRYFHKLYALDKELEGMGKPTKAQIEAAMKEHVIAKAELVGTYEKSK